MLDWSLAPSLPCTGMNITTALMLAIGIDRYFCLKYPLRYRQWSKKIYVSLVMLTCVVYDLSLKFVGYLTLSDHKVICLISAAYYGRGKDYWVFSQVTINFLVLVVYVRIKREMKSLTASIQNSHMMNIMYSLYIIVGFYIFGWFMTMCGCGVVRLITTEPNFTVTAELSVGVFANINMAIPAFVYFTRSVEYKGALKRLMGRNAVGASGAVVSISQASRNANAQSQPERRT
ncbi:hypothetical protein QR680_012216 [Steinernema hermaphroditum]|uniref:G-protein coupled receptors family 1 profile domain-containing protein n=1 Tax=Steinernema hermaphroditum TaxID=289476 RepID=A0AA39M0E3_9BILA|nr:hypothetical protein QR680_012216 [Steinernema hermaphroditum]